MTQAVLFGTPFATYTAAELLWGFETTAADKINGGCFFCGTDYRLVNQVTPILNDQIGTVAEAWYGLYTGSNLLNQTSIVRIVNEEAYTNRIVPVWNGTYVTPVTLNPDGSVGFATAQGFTGVSNGMQFPPYMDEDPVKIYDTRSVQINTYDMGDESEIGGKKIQARCHFIQLRLGRPELHRVCL